MNELIEKVKNLLFSFMKSNFVSDMASEIKQGIKLLTNKTEEELEIKSALSHDIKNDFAKDFNKERTNGTNEEN